MNGPLLEAQHVTDNARLLLPPLVITDLPPRPGPQHLHPPYCVVGTVHQTNITLRVVT